MTTPVVASLNLASAARDEIHNPLRKRLSAIVPMLKFATRAYGVNIIALQELRLSVDVEPLQILLVLVTMLGGRWDLHYQKVNPSDGAFHRAILWRADIWSAVNHRAQYVTNTRESHFPYLISSTDFTSINSKNISVEFTVINCHAPMNRGERLDYWTQVSALMGSNVIAIGDFNKFETETDKFNEIFEGYLDLVAPGVTTFKSFDNDRKPDGTPWVSSLDGVIVHPSVSKNSKLYIIPTDTDPRESDHYLIVANVAFTKLINNGPAYSE